MRLFNMGQPQILSGKCTWTLKTDLDPENHWLVIRGKQSMLRDGTGKRKGRLGPSTRALHMSANVELQVLEDDLTLLVSMNGKEGGTCM